MWNELKLLGLLNEEGENWGEVMLFIPLGAGEKLNPLTLDIPEMGLVSPQFEHGSRLSSDLTTGTNIMCT